MQGSTLEVLYCARPDVNIGLTFRYHKPIDNTQYVTSPFFKDMLALYALEILLSDHTCDTTTRSRNTRLFMLHILNLSLPSVHRTTA